MTKIMLVEDDNNLREIYEARLSAEGYDIVSAHDGEAALAMAAKERPDLVITDVMMPKISGFEMLDILRNTASLHDIKVIMLTALGQAEDNARANALGADRYLVKSQVTLEDIVKATHEVLNDPTPLDVSSETAEVSIDQAAPDSTASHIEVVPPIDSSATTQTDLQADLPSEPETPFIDVSQGNSYVVGATDATATTTDQSAQTTQDDTVATPDDTATSDNVINNDVTSDDAVEPIAELPAPNAVVEQPEILDAAPIAQEETVIREQIDEFLDANTQPEVATNPDNPSDSNDQPTVAETQPSDQPVQSAQPDQATQPPADEDDAVYEKDNSIPDMGNLSIHGEVAPELQEIAPEPQEAPAEPQQYSGDKVVSDAINDMYAAAAPVPRVIEPTPQSEYPVEITPTTAPSPSPVVETPQPIEAPRFETPESNDSNFHKLVIAPLDNSPRPDINQLLAMEDAKAAAIQASNTQQTTADTPSDGQSTQSQPGQTWQPQPAQVQPPRTSYDPAIDPNSISL